MTFGTISIQCPFLNQHLNYNTQNKLTFKSKYHPFYKKHAFRGNQNARKQNSAFLKASAAPSDIFVLNLENVLIDKNVLKYIKLRRIKLSVIFDLGWRLQGI